MSLTDYLAQMQNPFATAVVTEREIYSPEIIDVDSIHREARQALREGIARAAGGQRRRGRRSHLLVINGEAGDGKSHLLAWLSRQRFCDFHFIAVPPLPDAAEPFRHVLRHALACLRRPRPTAPPPQGPDSANTHDIPLAERLSEDPAGYHESPLSQLVWESLYQQARDLVETARAERYEGGAALPRLLVPLCEDPQSDGRPRGAAAFATLAAPRWAEIAAGLLSYVQGLPSEHPIDLLVRAVLVHYPDPAQRALCTAWLAGEDLGDADLQRLGVKQLLDSEAAARRVLTSLCRMTAAPLVLCFDQIEGITDRLQEAGLRGLVEVIRDIYTQGAACQVVTCQTTTWAQLGERLLRQIPGRTHQVSLARLLAEQIRDLVLARLSVGFAAGPPRPFPSYPFAASEIEALARDAGVNNARAALRLFEGEFERRRDLLVQPGQPVNASELPPPVTDESVVSGALQAAELSARAGFSGTLPGQRASSMRAVFKELWDGLRPLSVGAPIQVVSCDPILGGGLRLSLQPAGDVRRARAALEICNADAGPAVFSATSRILRQVSDGRAEMALLLREEGLPLSTGPQRLTQSVEAQLGKSGGVVWLPEEDVVELLAIERVLHAASSGELLVGPRALTRAETLALLLARGGEVRPPRVVRRIYVQLGLTAG